MIFILINYSEETLITCCGFTMGIRRIGYDILEVICSGRNKVSSENSYHALYGSLDMQNSKFPKITFDLVRPETSHLLPSSQPIINNTPCMGFSQNEAISTN